MSEQLRVMLVLGPSAGGIGRHVATVATALNRRGHDVTVCGPAAADATFRFAASGVRFVATPLGSSSVRALRPVAAVTVRRAAADVPPDVVHAHGLWATVAAAAACVRPLVSTWHNAPVGGSARRALHWAVERVAAHRADLNLCASEDLVVRAANAGAHLVRFLPVVAPALPPPHLSPAELRAALDIADRPVVLAVARLSRQKRLDLLVEATRGWAADPHGPVVVVAGEGRQRTALEAAARAARSPLRLLGHRKDVGDLLAAADVVVLPSEWEARPLIAQEALRAGVPLVATAVGGIPGLVGDAAVLVPKGDAVMLRERLRSLLDDPDERHRLRDRGRRQAMTWPTVDDMVDALVAAYLEVASRVGGR